MSNFGLDQFWAQTARQQQPQGLDIAEVVRHVVPAVLSSLSAGQQWAQQWNNAQGYAGQFGQGQSNFGQSNFGQQQGYGQQGNHQLQPQQLNQLIQAVVPAVLNAVSAQQGGAQNWGQQANAGGFGNAQQSYGQQAYGQQGNAQLQPQHLGHLIQAIVPAVLNAVSAQQQGGAQNWGAQQSNGGSAFSPFGGNAQQPYGQQNYGQQGNAQLQPQQLGQLIQAIVPAVIGAVSAGSQGNGQWNRPQQGGFQQQDAQQYNPANAFGSGQNPYDQQQLQGVDLSLLIKAIVPDITKAVVPIVLSTLSGPQQQQSRHIN